MAVHVKTRRRLRILLIGLIVLCVLGAGGYLLRKRQVAAQLVASRDAGFAAFQLGEYYTAMHKIGPYLQRHPTDVDALFKYATARANVEDERGKHVMEAISFLRRLLELQPDHAGAREQLLNLYVAARLNTEILDATKDRKDAPSLRARTAALTNLNKEDEARSATEAYLKLKPDDLGMQKLYLYQLHTAGQTREQIVEYATKLQASSPDEVRFQLLLGFAYALTSSDTQNPDKDAVKWTMRAVSKPLDDPDLVKQAVDQLDSLNQQSQSIAVLTQAAGVKGDVRFDRMLATRLYQAGRFAEVIARTDALEARGDKADTELLGHRAMALLAQKKLEAAQQVIKLLASRQTDLPARSWAAVLSSLPAEGQPSADKKLLEACRDGLKVRGDNPYFRLHLGDLYMRLGETDEAARAWAMASRIAPAWPTPIARLLQLAPQARIEELARQALFSGGDDPAVMSIVALARFRVYRQQPQQSLDEVLALTERVQQLEPGEQITAFLRVVLLDALGRGDEARGAIESALKADPAPPRQALLALASASETLGYDKEQAIYDRCRAAHGPSVELALARAAWLLGNKQPADALASFETARAESADKDSLRWRSAWTTLLEQAGDERATKLWAELADAYPDDLAVQRGAMVSAAAQKDRDLVRRAIDRIGAAMAGEGANWRIADARWTMQGAALKPTPQEREQELVKAAATLSDVTRRYPDLLASRQLLASCLNQLGKEEGAIEQLTAAVRLAPGSASLRIDLARLLQRTGDFQRDRQYIEEAEEILRPPTSPAVASAPAPEPGEAAAPAAEKPSFESNWRDIASLYVARGQTDRAVKILQELNLDSEHSQDLSLASLLARQGTLSDEMARNLLEKPTPAAIRVVADSYARQGRTAEAEAALKLLDTISVKPGEKEHARGIYYWRRGDLKTAADELSAACEAAPAMAGAWRALISVLLLDGRGEEAVAAASRAAGAIPDDQGLARVAKHAETVNALSADPRDRPLLVALLEQGEDGDTVVEATNIVSRARQPDAKPPAALIASELRPLAERARPRAPPVLPDRPLHVRWGL